MRDISYDVDITVFDEDKFVSFLFSKAKERLEIGFFLNTLERSKTDQMISSAVKYHLYEFNNSYSKQISVFYNPLDPKQKQEFFDLLSSYLNPKIADKGLKVADISWEVR